MRLYNKLTSVRKSNRFPVHSEGKVKNKPIKRLGNKISEAILQRAENLFESALSNRFNSMPNRSIFPLHTKNVSYLLSVMKQLGD